MITPHRLMVSAPFHLGADPASRPPTGCESYQWQVKPECPPPPCFSLDKRLELWHSESAVRLPVLAYVEWNFHEPLARLNG